MEATLLLCDYADQVNGKLYIMGGGWSVAAADRPLSLGLAVRLLIPWDQANRPHAIEIRLVTEDDEPVLDTDGKPIRLDGKVEVGRPPGIPPGTPLDAAVAVNVGPLPFQPGGYVWQLLINGHKISEVAFRTVEVSHGPR